MIGEVVVGKFKIIFCGYHLIGEHKEWHLPA